MEKMGSLANGGTIVVKREKRQLDTWLQVNNTGWCARPPLPHPARLGPGPLWASPLVMWCSKWFQLWVFPKPVPTDTTSLWVVWEQLNQRMADTIYFYAIRQGNWMTTFTELLPQIKDFWELKDRETQFVKMLFTRWCFLTVMTKHGSTLNLKCQEREKRSNEHHCTFRSLLIYVKTGQITFLKKNWANNF